MNIVRVSCFVLYMLKMNFKKWVQLSVVNLLIVAILGAILRYKIAFSLPIIDQERLLHAHSHFAFGGWVSQILMAFIVSRLSVAHGKDLFKKYNTVLWANMICAYGMLISFPLQGYGLVSILFSTATLFISYIFMGYVWLDTKKSGTGNILYPWFRGATFFNALSSLGAFSLAYMMATNNAHQDWYLASVYFFLHFQYNGWFSLVILGLLSEKLTEAGVSYKRLIFLFRLFAFACIPIYFLSILWIPIPLWMYSIVTVSAILQLSGWVVILMMVYRKKEVLKKNLPPLSYVVLLLSLTAFSMKFILQLGSAIPALSAFAYGSRPIIIGYLHLVLLGAISLFILSYSIHKRAIKVNAGSKIGLYVFISGIILNELILMIQGFALKSNVSVPYVNEWLFLAALVLVAGMTILVLNLQQKHGASYACTETDLRTA